MNRSILARPLVRGLLSWGAALAFVALWYQGAQMAIGHLFHVRPWNSAYLHDLGAHLILGALLFGISRSLPRFMLTAGALFTALTLSNAIKLSVLGAPIMPDDFVSARNMLLLLDGWLLAGALVLIAAPLILLGWTIAWRRPRAWMGLGATGLAVVLLAGNPGWVAGTLDHELGNSVWNQPENYQRRGLPIHLLQETARNLARREEPPTIGEVQDALAYLGDAHQDSEPKDAFVKVSASSGPRRNVHMILLESFWDPTVLKASRLSADPLDPRFRRLWGAAKHSHLLSPVFGGYTANTEFEALCGFPVTADNVFFETGLRRDVPCLPRHLDEAGYHTVASHPNAASFWNRVNAYRRIGFQTYLADKDFELDDMNRSFLSDSSLYRQVLERLEPELRASKPVFDYILTYFGHLPYPLNDRRPPVITAAKGHETVAAYANTVYYKSRELMDFLERLRQVDPDGLVVLFGDHLPALEPNFGGYTESGLLGKRRGDFADAMFKTLVSTPLVVIDGRRGPVAVGDVPAYRLPDVLLRLLGDRQPTIMRLTAQPDQPPVRPLPGLNVSLLEDQVEVCRGEETDAPGCAAPEQWVRAVETLRTDIFSGEQHALLDVQTPSDDFRQASVKRPATGLSEAL